MGAALLLLPPGCSKNLPSFACPSLEAPGSLQPQEDSYELQWVSAGVIHGEPCKVSKGVRVCFCSREDLRIRQTPLTAAGSLSSHSQAERPWMGFERSLFQEDYRPAMLSRAQGTFRSTFIHILDLLPQAHTSPGRHINSLSLCLGPFFVEAYVTPTTSPRCKVRVQSQNHRTTG